MTSPETEVYPSACRYLAALPDGADSYPESTCKGALVRATLAELPHLPAAATAALPPCLIALRDSPPDVGAWTPTVHHNALLGAVYDARYSIGGLAAFERAAFEKSRKLLGGPLYRVLFALVATERVVRASERRWRLFHRGSTLAITGYREGHFEAVLTYPPNLFFDVPLRSLGQGLRAAIAASGAKDTVLRCECISPTSARYDITWPAARAQGVRP